MKLVLHPPVEPERLARITETADPMTVVNAADEAEALRPDARRRRLLRQDHAAAAGRGAAAALGAGADGQPRTLPLSRAGRPSVRADQHARPVLRRDRRSGDGLHHLLRPQSAPLHPPAGARPLGADRRRDGARRLRHGAGRRQRHRPRSSAPGRLRRSASSAWARIGARLPGGAWRSACACWPSIRCARRRRRRRGAVAGRSDCRTCWAKAISWSSPLRTRRKRRNCSAGRSFSR